jgi:circadian clock protein KaiC
VIFQRCVEMEGRMRKVMSVIKMRGSDHSKDLRLYEVTPTGVEIGSTLYEYRGVIAGVARRHRDDESHGGSAPHRANA